jgi:hypothetical protein
MWGHPTDERLLDLVEGRAIDTTRAHVEACGQCRERVETARGGLLLAREADVLPEPSPMYWEAFRRQVDRQIVAAPAARRWSWGWRPALASGAALLALVAALLPGTRAPRPTLETRTLPAWSALPPVAEDASLALIGQLEPSEESMAAESSRPFLAGAVADLTEAEQQQLALALRALLQGERQGSKS